MATVERKTAETLLQYPRSIRIGKRKYRVSRITFASIVEMSAAISELPDTMTGGEDNLFVSTLRNAKDYGDTPIVLAVMMSSPWLMMLGRPGHWLFKRRLRRKAMRLSVRHSARELNEAAQTLIKHTDLADFFALTTFLAGINLTKATKVGTERTETTASGH